MAKKLLSISIEGMSLKLLLCQQEKVLAWATLPLNPRFLRGGFIAEVEGLANVVKTAISKKEFSGQHRVLAALPAFHSVCRPMELPNLPDAQPDIVIPQQARRDFGYSAEANLLFWQSLSSRGNQRRFLVISVPKQPVITLFQTLKQAGLNPTRIETNILALSRSVNQPQAIIAAVEPDSIHCIIMRDSLPLATRSTLLGEGPRDIQSLPPLVADTLENIITFHNESNPDNPLPTDIPLYLLGSALALNPDIVPSVQTALGRSVSEFTPPLLYPPDFPKAELAVNIGLVLKEL